MSQPTAPLPIVLGRFKRLPRRDTHTWQGGIVRMPMWVDSPAGGPPYRPWGAVWVTAPDGLVGLELSQSADRPGADLAVKALVELALRYQDQLMGRPGRLEVLDRDLGSSVCAALGDPSVAVDVVPELTDVKAVLRSFAEHQQTASSVPDLQSAGLAVDDVRAFAAAAERFYRAEPWQHLTNDDLMTVEMRGLDKRMSCATVMGNAGLQYGLAFHASPKDAAFVGGPAGLDARKTYWSVTFSRADEIPILDLELWDDQRLPLAGDEAYPLAMGFGPGDRFIRPPRKLLAQFAAVLAALAATSEQELDSGRWVKTIATGAGGTDVVLTLPHVYEPERGAQGPGTTGRDRRANERVQAEVGRFLASKDFANLDEANAALQERFSGRRAGDIGHTASTPLERAQDLVYDAFESVGRRRVILAREALALSPDCADAFVVLAEAAAGATRALPLYEQGLAAAERALGAERIARDVGHFWGRIETRPYMRARLGLAQTLLELGRTTEAFGHLYELIRLNPNDNQGVRFVLLAELVRARRDEEARALLQQYKDDTTAEWLYTWALVEFRTGSKREAEARLAQAFDANRFVPDALAVDPDLLPPSGDIISLGGPDEAVAYAEHFGGSWDSSPGALGWLRHAAKARRRGPQHRRGGTAGGRAGRR